MEACVVKKYDLKNVLSASGIEYDGTYFYIVGDDSPYLYVLDEQFELVKKEKLFEAEVKDSGRIRKKLKPDYEALTWAVWKGKKVLLQFGSGSKKLRESLLVYNTASGDTEIFSLESFYAGLRWVSKTQEYDFNIEAAVTTGDCIYLFDRGSNIIYRLLQSEFFAHITGAQPSMPAIECMVCKLPVLDNVLAGFSGACVYENQIFFSASLERTSNWIDDGQMLGSYVGILPVADFKNASPPCCLITENGQTYIGKVESLIMMSKTRNAYGLIAVTDDDNGNSALLEITVTT